MLTPRSKWTVCLAACVALALGASGDLLGEPIKIPDGEPKKFDGNAPETAKPAEEGVIVLKARNAAIYGRTLEYMREEDALGWWNSADDLAVWTIEASEAGEYDVTLEWSCDEECAGNKLLLEVAGQQLTGRVPSTERWENYQRRSFGRVTLRAGANRLAIQAQGPINEALFDLREVKLTPVAKLAPDT